MLDGNEMMVQHLPQEPGFLCGLEAASRAESVMYYWSCDPRMTDARSDLTLNGCVGVGDEACPWIR